MFGYTFSALFWVAIVLGVLMLWRGGGLNINGPTLVLRRFYVNESPADDVYLNITGRASGLIGWLLTVLGLDAETNLLVTGKEINLISSSLAGNIHKLVPVSKISSSHCGFKKPIGFLIAGAGILLLGLGDFRGLIICIIISLALVLIYYLQKKLAITIETFGGTTMGVVFKPSIIENVSVDMNMAFRAISVINQLVCEQNKSSRP